MSTAPTHTPSASETDPLLPQTTSNNQTTTTTDSQDPPGTMSRPSTSNIHYTLACLYGESPHTRLRVITTLSQAAQAPALLLAHTHHHITPVHLH